MHSSRVFEVWMPLAAAGGTEGPNCNAGTQLPGSFVPQRRSPGKPWGQSSCASSVEAQWHVCYQSHNAKENHCWLKTPRQVRGLPAWERVLTAVKTFLERQAISQNSIFSSLLSKVGEGWSECIGGRHYALIAWGILCGQNRQSYVE